MKYVIKVQAEKQLYLEAQLVVDIPDRFAKDALDIQRLCEQPAKIFVSRNDVSWEEIDYRSPDFSGVYSVRVDDNLDDEADIRFVYAKDGSLVPEYGSDNSKSE